MLDRPTAQDLERQLEALKVDISTTRHQFVTSLGHLADATKHLGKAIERLSNEREIESPRE